MQWNFKLLIYIDTDVCIMQPPQGTSIKLLYAGKGEADNAVFRCLGSKIQYYLERGQLQVPGKRLVIIV